MLPSQISEDASAESVSHRSVEVLDELGDQSHEGISGVSQKFPADPLIRRVKHTCQIDVNEDFCAALHRFGELVTEHGTPPHRRISRAELLSVAERGLIGEQRKFASEMQQFIRQTQSQHERLQEVHNVIETKLDQLRRLKQNAGQFVETAHQLDVDIKNVELKSKILHNFTHRFTLSATEVEELTFPDRKLEKKFFEALNRSQKIHDDCKILLLLQSSTQIMGLQLMEVISQYQEKGFQRLYKWSMEEIRKLSEDVQAVNPMLCEALGVLQQRPTLLKTVLDEYASVRKAFVTTSFVDALTQGTAAGSRPLELHSYDTLRYSTDMLGWLHQTVASEKDHWSTLTKNVGDVVLEEHVARVFGALTDGIIRPLRTRFERMTEVEQSAVSLFKIRHWTTFYIDKIRRSMSTTSEIPLLTMLSDVCENLQARYIFNLKNLASQMAKKVDVPPENLEPSPGLTSVLSVLRELISCQQSLNGVEHNEEALNAVLTIVIEPLLQMCSESAAHVSPNTPNATSIYLINCLHMIKSLLFSEQSADPRFEFLNRQSDAHVDTLINATTAFIIAETRMRPLLDLLRSSDETPVVAELPDIFFEEFMVAFDRYLGNPDEFSLPELHCLICPRSKHRVTAVARNLVVDFYRQIFPALKASKFSASLKSFDVVARLLAV